MQELEVQISKLTRLLAEARQTIDKSKSDRSSNEDAVRTRDQTIERLERENDDLGKECDQLIGKL